MTKKSLKSKSTISKPRNSANGVSYNRYSFDLGDVKILTDYLNQQTKDIIIKLYRSKKFDPKLYEEKSSKLSKQKTKQYSVLTELQAIQVIKEITLKEKRNLLKKQEQLHEIYLKKTTEVNQNNLSKIFTQQNNNSLDCRSLLHSLMYRELSILERQRAELQSQKEKNQLKIRELIEKSCLKIEKQIFIASISMIIQETFSQEIQREEQKNYQKVSRSIVIFEQSYPPQHFIKEQLIQLIGKQIYNKKLISALKLYHYSISQDNFYNPSFLTCHDCMKVISNKNHPQHDLHCSKTVEGPSQKDIKSEFAFTPYTFLTKIIQRQYFNHFSQLQIFSHPFIQYHLKTKTHQGLACGRHWCGQCMIKYKRGMSMNLCEFCDRICRCFRCKQFQKFVQLLAHFLQMGGRMEEIEDKFSFNRVFSQNEFQSNQKSFLFNANDFTSFPFKHQLKSMYEFYVKNKNIHTTKQWTQQEYYQLLSGIRPQFASQSSPSLLLCHQDQMRKKNKKNIKEQMELQQKKFRKLAEVKRERNIEARMSKLSEQTKQKFQQAQLHQFSLLKRKLQKSKILRFTNPVNNPRINHKSHDVVIISQSDFKKNERRFYEMVQIQEANPFKRVQQQRRYLKVKRLEEMERNVNTYLEKDLNQIIDEQDKIRISPGEAEELAQNNDKQPDENYGSIWE